MSGNRGKSAVTRSGGHRQKATDGRGNGVVKYAPHLAIPAAYMYALGASDDEVAAGLGVSQSSVLRWARVHPEFAKARRESKAFVEARLANALLQSAEGARKTELVEVYDPDTNTWTPKQRKVTELPPNPQAAMAWLHAQHPDNWREKQEIVVEVGSDTASLLQHARERMAQRIRETMQGLGEDE